VNFSLAKENAQFSFGDKLSIFSDKAYRKNNGKFFEAVGNVVIISQKDTLYGEAASFNQETLMAYVEGNVRLITKDLTLYGSHLEYNIATGQAVIKNARIMAMDFNLVANQLVRLNEKQYLAHESEFTTCKDCAESWSVYGKKIKIDVGEYVTIRHGLAKIKGVDVLYIPYIVLPIQSKRKTGLLFPKISSRLGEGIALEQPVFVALDESKDMTFAPTFWAQRGYGGDVQYRQRFNERTWFEANNRVLNDSIYLPGKSSFDKSGDEFFRYFTELESHYQKSPDWNTHLRYTGTRDLDIVRNFPDYLDDKNLSSEFGFKGFTDWRHNYFTVGVEANYLRNQLFNDPMEFDRNYVQVMPRLHFSSIPYSLLQTDLPFLQHIAVGFESSLTRFKQVDESESMGLRNANRFSAQPYLLWHFFTLGPISLKSRYILDQQSYDFSDPKQQDFGKNAGLIRTEMGFTMDRIFGLAYEEKIPIKYIPPKELEKLREKKEQGLTPIQKNEKKARLIGEIPQFESELVKDSIVEVRNSYRHSQQFNLIHHFISSENRYGNKVFEQQINQNTGWFDYEDARRSQEWRFGAATTRSQVSPVNTLEFEWNNTLVRKTPKALNYLLDEKYLRDNFTYTKVGYFNVSQGFLLNEKDASDPRQRLSRLLIESGYTANRWTFGLQEFYFHYENDNILTLNANRRFDFMNLLGSYNYNSFGQSNLKTLSLGGQIRPTDSLGFAVLKDMDLEANKNIRTIYALDIMPDNNCWILNLNYRESLVNSQYSFNILWNFGDDKFDQYRNNWFSVPRR